MPLSIGFRLRRMSVKRKAVLDESDLEEDISTSPALKRTRKCGNCRQQDGHDRRNCPNPPAKGAKSPRANKSQPAVVPVTEDTDSAPEPEPVRKAKAGPEPEVTFEQFKDEWLVGVSNGTSGFDKARRFIIKMLRDWNEIPFDSDDTIVLDASKDGGMDAVYLHKGKDDTSVDVEDEDDDQGDTWYVFQSKYGEFINASMISKEGNKVLETIDAKGTKPLSNAARHVRDRITNFLKKKSNADRIYFVLLTENPLDQACNRALQDIAAAGRKRFGNIFDVKSVSIETLWRLAPVGMQVLPPRKFHLKIRDIDHVDCVKNVIHVEVPLRRLYEFVVDFAKVSGGNNTQLFDSNLRQYLKFKSKVNLGMKETLLTEPQHFELYNNGIRLLTTDFEVENGKLLITDPSIPNGCQTTNTIFNVCHERLASGGTGSDEALAKWEEKLDRGNVSATIIRLGDPSDPKARELRKKITRYTNSQNAVRARDFLALDQNSNDWASDMAKCNVFLEIQRGAWEAQKAIQKKIADPEERFGEYANLFELIKIYCAGGLKQPGIAFGGQSRLFAPGGNIFKDISEGDGTITATDLMAAFLLQKAASTNNFGHQNEQDKRNSRRQTKFLFYSVTYQLVRDMLTAKDKPSSPSDVSRALKSILEARDPAISEALLGNALHVIDEYMTRSEDSESRTVYTEKLFTDTCGSDLNQFLKLIGKSGSDTPNLTDLLRIQKVSMKRPNKAGETSDFDKMASVCKF